MSSARIEELQAEIEALKTALAATEETSTQRATFLATMSHELREPMNGVLGMARLLRDTDMADEPRGYVEAVIDSAQSLITIINDILDLSRIDAGKLELVDVDFSVAVLFERLGIMLDTRARVKDLPLCLEVAEGLPSVLRGDPGRLRQILVNLAGNAIKFTSEGHVTVRVAPGKTPFSLQLSVEDTGIGIPEALQSRLFTAYAQADSTVPRLFGGSGLGLMIAQRLVQAMGGFIEVDSKAGEGTCFHFMVQLAEPNGKGEQREARADLAGASMLVVDPQKRSRQTVCELAKLWQMQARGVGSARAARAAVADAADRGHPFDIVLIDRSLPDETGDALGASLRQIDPERQSKLALMVASGMRGDAANAKANGFDAYLPKPLDGNGLLDSLQRLRGAATSELITIHSMSETQRDKLRLLIVDDNAVNCKLAEIMLKRAGHNVVIVHNGAEALEQVAEGEFDAILMDIQMPVMNGIEATRQIRQMADAKRRDVPIIAITANAMQGEDEPCYAAGMNAYVTKPIDRAALLAAIDRLVA